MDELKTELINLNDVSFNITLPKLEISEENQQIISVNPKLVISGAAQAIHFPFLNEPEHPFQKKKHIMQLLSLQQVQNIRESDDNQFKCIECNKSFSSKGNLIRHIIKHTGERPYSCKECEKRFAEKGDLQRHEKTHSGVKPFHCNICGKSFTRKSNLGTHLILHKDDFKCIECGKTFSRESHLEAHIRMHTGEKPFGCDLCDKAFGDKSHLMKHRRRHFK